MTTACDLTISTTVSTQDSRVLSKLELDSVRVLLSFVSREQNIGEETVQEIVGARFGVSDITQLQSHSYDEIVRFLVDVQIDIMLN